MPDDGRPAAPNPEAPPGPEETTLQALADTLTAERLVILPFYHELRNSFVKPERVKLQTEYFWQRWVPLLGPVRSLIVMRMRQYGYYNRHTKELRDECARTYEEIAASIGISTRSLERYFESEPDPNGGPYRVLKDPLLARFIRLRHQYVWRPGKAAPERTTNEYKIAMDEPLTPEDEAAFRLAAARRLRDGDAAPAAERASDHETKRSGSTRQNGGNSRGSPHRRQSVGYVEEPPDRQVGATDSHDGLAPQPVVPSNTSLLETTTTTTPLAAGEAVSEDPGEPARPTPARARPRGGSRQARKEGVGVGLSEAGGKSGAGAAVVRPADLSTVDPAAAPDLEAVIATFEAANDRSATRLERQLLADLAAELEPAARARGASGLAWVAAAIVEAVDSGSRFVAPKRVREICRRWSAEGPTRSRGQSKPTAPAGGRRGGQRRSQGTPERRPRAEPRDAAPEARPVEAAPESAAPGPTAEPPAPEPPTFVVLPSLNLTNKQLWAAVLDELRPSCPPGTFATWLKPSRLIGVEGETLVVGVPNSFARQWLTERFAGLVERAVGAVLGQARPVRFEVEHDWLARQAGEDAYGGRRQA